jgi:adenylate cyclase
MFIDMRESTRLAETRLPFDAVFIVNRFLTTVSEAVVKAGGAPNQFVGDGLLALFGLTTNRDVARRQALHAAASIGVAVDRLNALLDEDLTQPIRFGIGIHAGKVVVGDIGYKGHYIFTALGDAVNVSARLQDLTKEFNCEVVLSHEVCPADGLATAPQATVPLRGRSAPLGVYAIARARDIVSQPEAPEATA